MAGLGSVRGRRVIALLLCKLLKRVQLSLLILREMGKIIHEIAAGGKTGLQRMGFIHETEKQTIAAFINFYENLHYRLAPARRVQMGFGVFTAEHCLCKSDRLDTKLFKKLALACANLNDTD